MSREDRFRKIAAHTASAAHTAAHAARRRSPRAA